MAALLPVVIGVVAILGTLAVLYILGNITSVSIYSLNLTTAMGLGLAIDYGLLVVNRYREELDRGATTEDAVIRSVRSAGRTVSFSATTVAAAMATLLVFPVAFLRSFAYAGVSVVIVATASALLILPAMLAVLGPRVNMWSVRTVRSKAESGVWRRVATAVMRRPLLAGIPVLLLLIALGSPFLNVHFGTPDDRVLPTSSPVRQAGDALRTNFPASAYNTLEVITSAALTPTDQAAYSSQLSALSGVASLNGPEGTWMGGSRTVGATLANARFAAPGGDWFFPRHPPQLPQLCRREPGARGEGAAAARRCAELRGRAGRLPRRPEARPLPPTAPRHRPGRPHLLRGALRIHG
ncbi:MAG: MMPL family transporter, partial [Acidimicrobiales bacterium]